MSINENWNNFLTEEDLKAAGIIVCMDDDQQFLIIRRANAAERTGQWTIPGGHIDDEDASIEAGSIRELKEETNLNCSEENLVFLGEPKPQKYYFYAKEWSGTVDVLIPNPKTNEIEHDKYRWATIDEVKDIDNSEIPIYLLEKALEMSKNETDS